MLEHEVNLFAGCGRTGVLCVIDYTWRLLKKQMIPADFNIFNIVQSMRTQRPSVVQTKEQYELVYRTIRLLFERFLQEEQSVGEVRGRKHSLRFKIDKALHQQSVRQVRGRKHSLRFKIDKALHQQSVRQVRGRKHSLRFKVDKALHQQSVRQVRGRKHSLRFKIDKALHQQSRNKQYFKADL
ncbi:hypothetical protein NQZ68_035037 [Dissostichus eleginoides]|nr:hypothetical protein NQZ68_035037 [Dissostichus eleginoides]